MISSLAAALGALLSALGMGGGGVLILYLTLMADMKQLEAQGINLVFFLPVAAVAIFFHQKNRLISWRMVLPFAALGSAGVYFGQRLAVTAGSELLGKLFGGFLLIIGLRELFGESKNKESKEREEGMKK